MLQMQQYYYKLLNVSASKKIYGVVLMKEILREIGMIARALDSISNIEFKEYELTKGQYLYLVRICENPGIIQEKLAEMIKVDRTTAARAIKNLKSMVLLKRETIKLTKDK